jgi:RecQ family ATP-dependent DNA helicase
MDEMNPNPRDLSSLDLAAALRAHFGYEGFRPGQEAIVRSVLEGRPTIAILPTGGGKSLCFQLPALLLPGTTVVASPLVALMKDQVDALCARGIAATFINSSLSESERQERQAQLRKGAYRLVYVAPERFRSHSFLQALSAVRVPLLAVDEAHCISSWGHDFRPDYQRLAQARTQIAAERVLALTATATAEVRKDIAVALQLEKPRVFVAGFDRPNLFIEIARASGDKDKLGRLLALARGGGQGLVYAATRRNVEKTVGALRENGIDAMGYHAGMEDRERTSVQERYLRGESQVIVATNAFGMGVDKPDIRFVAHFDIPRSVEAYYQEIGRAGRDGKQSLALLLFNFADVMLQRRLIDSGRASEGLVQRVWSAAVRLTRGTHAQLARAAGVDAFEAASAVRLLESAGHLERARARGPSADFAVLTPDVDASVLEIDFEMLAQRVERERKMLDRMVRLADTSGCRRANLLRYFGDVEIPAGCPACDNCAGPRAPAAAAASGLRAAKRRPTARGGTPAPAAPETPEAPHDEQVLAKLRALRSEIARETHVPPYVVFHDATLRELSRALPRSESQFLAVKGAGPARWEKYGARVLAVTAAGAERRMTSSPEAAAPGSGWSTVGRAGADAPTAPAAGPAPAPYSPPGTLASNEGRLVRELSWGGPSGGDPGKAGHRKGGSTAPLLPQHFKARGRVDEAPAGMPAWLATAPPPIDDARGAAGPAVFPRPAGKDPVLSACAEGATLAEIARRTGKTVSEIAAVLAQARANGASFDLARLLGGDRLTAIREASTDCDGDLVAVRRKLPFSAQLAEIRIALL